MRQTKQLLIPNMFSRSRSQRNREVDFFLQHEELKRREYKLAAESRQQAPTSKTLGRVHNVNVDRQEWNGQQDADQEFCAEFRQGNSVQQESNEERTVEPKIRYDVREFLEKRAEQRRLYQANKNKALLAEFLEQRAKARREYREAKARGELASTCRSPRNGRQQEVSDSPETPRMPTADGAHQHARLRGIEIESGTVTTSVRKLC